MFSDEINFVDENKADKKGKNTHEVAFFFLAMGKNAIRNEVYRSGTLELRQKSRKRTMMFRQSYC